MLQVLLLGRWCRRATLPEATIQGFAGAYGNIGYLGPPLAIAAFGTEAGVPVAMIFCLDNSMHFTMAPLLMTLGGATGDRADTGHTSPLRLSAMQIALLFEGGGTAQCCQHVHPAPVAMARCQPGTNLARKQGDKESLPGAGEKCQRQACAQPACVALQKSNQVQVRAKNPGKRK